MLQWFSSKCTLCGGHHRSVPVSERSCIDVVPAQKRLDS
jgi:hypothetical protein